MFPNRRLVTGFDTSGHERSRYGGFGLIVDVFFVADRSILIDTNCIRFHRPERLTRLPRSPGVGQV
jgi:hypothetical protein